MDRENVVKALGLCARREPGKYTCNKCPYETRVDGDGCEVNLMLDAMALLKEQPEIVHCEECNKYDQETGRCANKTVHGNAKIWLCADGERAENAR